MDEQNTATETELTKTALESLEKLARDRHRVIERDGTCRLVERAVEQFDVCKATSIDMLFFDVRVDCMIDSLDDLVPVLRFLGQQGWHQRREPHDMDDRRTYTLEKRGVSYDMRIHAMTGENSRCRTVKVGEETRPVYKMKCDAESE